MVNKLRKQKIAQGERNFVPNLKLSQTLAFDSKSFANTERKEPSPKLHKLSKEEKLKINATLKRAR